MLEVRPARNGNEVITKRDSVVNTGIHIFLTQPLYLLMVHTFKWIVQKIDSRFIEKNEILSGLGLGLFLFLGVTDINLIFISQYSLGALLSICNSST